MTTEGSTNPFSEHAAMFGAEPERIGFGPRLMAFIIDILAGGVLGGLLIPIFKNFGSPTSQAVEELTKMMVEFYEIFGFSEMSSVVTDWMPAIAFGSLVGNICYALIEGLTGASPGKMAMKIKIARQDARAANMGMWLRRYGIKNINLLLSLLAYIPGVSFLDSVSFLAWIIINFGCFLVLSSSRLALHDYIAQTAVYHKDDIKP